MIYVGFMKNFVLADTSELLAVLPISAYFIDWAQKTDLIPTKNVYTDIMYVKFMRKIFLSRFERTDGC